MSCDRESLAFCNSPRPCNGCVHACDSRQSRLRHRRGTGTSISSTHADELQLLCPMALSFEIPGERWTRLIVRALFVATPKFQPLSTSMEVDGSCAGTAMPATKRLGESGGVRRQMRTGHPQGARYALTDRRTRTQSAAGATAVASAPTRTQTKRVRPASTHK